LMREGAYDIIEKPLDINVVIQKVRNILKKVQDAPQKAQLQRIKSREVKPAREVNIIGESDSILNVKNKIEVVAKHDSRVLVIGENGTGKELVAKLIHSKSPRAAEPLIEVNCAAIPSELIESEMFGHEKGAFTGAFATKKGKFEIANNGTLFLDEIGDMSLAAQAKVLRALQENCVTAVGGSKSVKVDVRLICATNKDLRQEIKNGNFREDLYHRIGAAILKVPPLRERKGDIRLLIDHFVERFIKEKSLRSRVISSEAYDVFESHGWSGNIRELQNVVERLLIFGADSISGEYAQKLLDEDY
ncbi:MAG: sigma-54 dependent transcriptional regulator, partial [Rikenellaceae bacterium]